MFPNPDCPEFIPSPSSSPVANSSLTEQTMLKFSNIQLQETDWEVEVSACFARCCSVKAQKNLTSPASVHDGSASSNLQTRLESKLIYHTERCPGL